MITLQNHNIYIIPKCNVIIPKCKEIALYIYMIRVQIFINPGVVAFTAYDLLNCSTEKIYSNCLKICSLYFIR